MEEYSNGLEIGVPNDYLDTLHQQSTSQNYVTALQQNTYPPAYEYIQPAYGYSYEFGQQGYSYPNPQHSNYEQFFKVKLFCNGRQKIFDMLPYKVFYPRDLFDIHFHNSYKNYYFKLWSRINQPKNSFQLEYKPLERNKQIIIDNNLEYVFSLKNFITVDFFQCDSKMIFDDISYFLKTFKFTFIPHSSNRFVPNGAYNTPKRIFVSDYFISMQNEHSILLQTTIETFTKYYERPTISFIIYNSERERQLLLNWINRIPHNTTIFKLIDLNITYTKLKKKIERIQSFLF